MNSDYLDQPCVPVAYAQLFIELAEKRGLDPAAWLATLGISLPLQAEARLSLRQIGVLLLKIVDNNPDDPIGYELGLASSLTRHGFVGFGLMCQPTVREAINFGLKFVNLLTPHMRLELVPRNGGETAMRVTPVVDLGPLRRQLIDYYLVSLWKISSQLAGEPGLGLRLFFDYPEPKYYADFCAQLPHITFQSDKNELRGFETILDHALPTADPATAELVASQCERQINQLRQTQTDFLSRVRGAICSPAMGYADQVEVASRVNLSPRGLKRKLLLHGTSYRDELNAIRLADAKQLLRDTSLSISLISERLGYTNPENFTRAFRRLTGQSPSNFRKMFNQNAS